MQQHLVTLDRLVKADPELSKEIPDLLGLMKTVLDRLEKEPAVVELTDPATQQKVKVTISKAVLQLLTTNLFGGGEASLPGRYYALAKGDFSGVARVWWGQLRRQSNIGSAMSAMMDCLFTQDQRRDAGVYEGTAGLDDTHYLATIEICAA